MIKLADEKGIGEVIFTDDVQSTTLAERKNPRENCSWERREKGLNFNGFVRPEKVGDLLG